MILDRDSIKLNIKGMRSINAFFISEKTKATSYGVVVDHAYDMESCRDSRPDECNDEDWNFILGKKLELLGS